MATKLRTAPRRAPTQARSRATVDAILGATTYILVRDGYRGLTTNRVAERAGVNIASLYQFFPNKESLVVELECRHLARTDAAMRAVLERSAGGSLAARLRALVEAYAAAQAVDPALARVFADELPRLRGRPSPSAGARCAGEIAALFAGVGLALPRPELAGWIVATVCEAVVHEASVQRPQDLRSGALADELVVLLERFLRRGPRSKRVAVRRRVPAR